MPFKRNGPVEQISEGSQPSAYAKAEVFGNIVHFRIPVTNPLKLGFLIYGLMLDYLGSLHYHKIISAATVKPGYNSKNDTDHFFEADKPFK